MKILKSLFQPFGKVPRGVLVIVNIAWVLLLLALFQILHSPIVPAPSKIATSFYQLVQSEDFWANFLSSFFVTIKAMGYSIAITMVLVYLSTIPILKLFAQFASKCRYLTLTGLVVLFTFFAKDLGQLKISLLLFGIVPYFVTSFLSVIESIPQQQIDKAMVNRKTPWGILYEIVIVGRLDQLFEVMRQNFAISWMMITMVEAYDMSGGGIGTMLIKSNRHLDLAPIFAMLFAVLLIGVLFDWGLRKIRYTLFDYLTPQK
jgi:NitT/TauT family transport system permease protein